MATPAAVAHYAAQAQQARRERVILPWGESYALVECEDCEDHGPIIHRVKLNDVWIDADGNVPDQIYDQWLQRLRGLRALSIAANKRAARWVE